LFGLRHSNLIIICHPLLTFFPALTLGLVVTP
jgi:hypothetical protein